jgi:hypothetical protein
MKTVEMTTDEVMGTQPDISKCVDCGNFIGVITDEHRQWYKDHDLSVPKRCAACLKKKPKLYYEDSKESVGSKAIQDAFAKANYNSEKMITYSPNEVVPKKKLVKSSFLRECKTRIEIPHVQTAEERGIELTNSHTCISCNESFEMTMSDEKWYADKGLVIPKRCKPCREQKKASKEVAATAQPVEQKMNEHTCTDCQEVFQMSEQHEKWFTDKQLLIPTRCPKCVAKRKSEKAAVAQ